MAKRVAVVLSGCGVFDGAEIHESVLALLRLDQKNAQTTIFAPDIPQRHVVNHLTSQVAAGEQRNVLVEAARIARGHIQDVRQARVEDFDALIVPGGFGAAKNLSDFAVAGAALSVQPDFLAFARGMKQAGKPIGLICIAPTMSAAICGEGVSCTIGSDPQTAAAIEATGARHVNCDVNGFHVDAKNKLVTTPAYMLAGRISEAAAGIFCLVDAVLDMA